MRQLPIIGLGFLLLAAQSALTAWLPLDPFFPHLLLPITIYLGVATEISLIRGAILAFVLGYLLDSFCGSPLGLQTFVLVATFIAARSAGLRLLLRGAGFQMALTALVTLCAGAAVMALRAIFERPSPFPVRGVGVMVRGLVFQVVATALVAPPVFAMARRVHDWTLQRRDEKGVARS